MKYTSNSFFFLPHKLLENSHEMQYVVMVENISGLDFKTYKWLIWPSNNDFLAVGFHKDPPTKSNTYITSYIFSRSSFYSQSF